MYICRECNAKYKSKPDYCECGNDCFEFLEDAPVKKPLTLEQKSEIVSKVFFAICIILSILVWLIPVNSKEKPVQKQIKTFNTAIPDIDKLWNDTPAYQPQVPENTVVEPENNNIISKIFKNTEQNKQPVQKTENKSTIQIFKPVQQTNTAKKQEQPKIPDKTLQAANSSVNSSKPVQQQKPKKVEQKTVQQTNPPKTLPKYNPNSSAMIDYKTKLRAQLFSKFAVGSVQGSGSCSISFSVDKSGKLINRKFVQESDNKSLNDTVYYMLMSVPYFTAPPAGYNGETIHMNFKMDNGSYEISIY